MIFRPPSLLLHLPAMTATTGDGRSILNAWALVGLIAAILFVFFFVVTLVAVLRRQRRARRARDAAGPAPTVDPWREAGQRAQPYPSATKKQD